MTSRSNLSPSLWTWIQLSWSSTPPFAMCCRESHLRMTPSASLLARSTPCTTSTRSLADGCPCRCHPGMDRSAVSAVHPCPTRPQCPQARSAGGQRRWATRGCSLCRQRSRACGQYRRVQAYLQAHSTGGQCRHTGRQERRASGAGRQSTVLARIPGVQLCPK
jgi:hypothetical protein